ncbi:hypothetical protein FI667_g7357, partial [Globisporangium splendens]
MDMRARQLQGFDCTHTFNDALPLSFEALMREVYFLQHRNFTLFDTKEAFHSSTGANERYLIHRDFQHAIAKLVKARSYNAPSTDSKRRGPAAAALLLEELAARQRANPSGQQPRMDTLRLHMVQHSVLEITHEIKDAFAQSLEPELDPQMYFAHFVELFCRVASGYHNQLLVREGAQLRRAVESCHLEFSIELLLQHMNIKILHDDNSLHAATSSSGTRQQQQKSCMEPPRLVIENGATEPDVEGLTLEIDTQCLRECRWHLERLKPAKRGIESLEVQVFFHLTTASVLDSARNDFQALLHYYEALKLADVLTLHHPGRVLVKSCLGCMLYYASEIGLAKKCHQHVLDARRLAVGDEHIDTATAMNNLACCLSQDPTGTAMEEAFLLLENAKRIYSDAFDASHPRVEVMMRNLEHVNACQRMIVVDPVDAVERGEYAHIIPGSRFQIQALVPNVDLKKSTATKTGKKEEERRQAEEIMSI